MSDETRPGVTPNPPTEAPRPPDPVPALPTPRRLLGTSLDLLRRSATEVRRGALAVGLQSLGLLGPLLVLVAVAVARLPDPEVLFGAAVPVLPADAELAGLLGLGILIALAGATALAIESRAIGLALVGARVLGRPFGLADALRRSRRAFWRLVLLAAGVELPLGLVGSLAGETLAGPGGAGSPLGAGLGVLVAVALQAPLAYAAAGIVVADLGIRAAVGGSVRLVARAPRTAAVVVAVGAAAQVLLLLALNGGLEVVAVLADLADLGLAGDPTRTFVTLVVLLGASSAVGSLLFSVTCLAVAPPAVVVALAGPPRGLEPAVGPGGRGSERWLSVPMALGIATAVVISIVGIQNVLGRG